MIFRLNTKHQAFKTLKKNAAEMRHFYFIIVKLKKAEMEQQQTEAPLNQIRLKETELHIDARFDRVDRQLKINR